MSAPLVRVLVCGGRGFNDRRSVDTALASIRETHGLDVLIHGGADGADDLARQWAENYYISTWCFPANWCRHGEAAGPMRNLAMLSEGQPSLVVAFPGGPGTANMVDIALQSGVTVRKIEAWGTR